MPRYESGDLTEILKAYKVRLLLDIHKNDGTTLKLSRGSVATYNNWIRSASNLNITTERPVDHITIVAQNVDSALGFNLASNLRLFDYATVDYKKQYQSLRNPALVETIDQLRGVIANARTDEERFTCELIADYESLGAIIASRGLTPRCWATYKNGIECTSVDSSTTCPKTRRACAKRNREYEFMGWEFFEQPVSAPPGTGGNEGGGGGQCFTLETKVSLPSGDRPIGDLPLGPPRERIAIVTFDKLTGEIDYDDEIVNVWEHDADGCFTLGFDHAELEVTPEHGLWLGDGEFRRADAFAIGDLVWTYDWWWSRTRLTSIRWNSDRRVKVRNLTTKRNGTYFANRTAVSNSKIPEFPI